jgi:hypothetical protein
MRKPDAAWQGLTRPLLMRVVLVWLAVAALSLVAARANIADLRFSDPDDTLRLVQVRNLLAGQGWFDVHMSKIDPPAGVLMHWSRLVDIPLALVILALTPLVGTSGAETAAVIAVPLLTLLCGMLLTARLAARLADERAALVACLLWPLALATMTQFAPLRIDHHGWQVVALLAAANALFTRDARTGGWLCGAALATGMAISLELLPYAALFAGVLALRWLRDPEARVGVVAMLESLALSGIALFLLTRGADLTGYCDIASPGYLAGFAVAAAGVRLVAWRNPPSGIVLLALGVVAAAVLASFLAVSPQCTRGPFAELDPLVQQVWYRSVLEGLPVWKQPVVAAVQIAAPPIIALAAALFLWRGAAASERRREWFEFVLLLAGFTLVALLVSRAGAAACALSTVAVAAANRPLLARIEALASVPAKLAALVLVLAALAPGMVAFAIDRAMPSAQAEPARAGMSNVCGLPGSLAALRGLPRSTLFTPLDLGPWALLHTDHAVVATSHHRASAAMHDVIAAFLGTSDEAQALVRKHGAAYVVACDDLVEAGVYRDMAGAGLMAKLLAGRPPAWLQPVALPATAGTLRVWRVVG